LRGIAVLHAWPKPYLRVDHFSGGGSRAIEGNFWRGAKPGREFSREVVLVAEVESAVARAAEILAAVQA
jgi:hypothetical protein